MRRLELNLGPPDNAVMIAWAAMHRFARGDFDAYDVLVKPVWELEEFSTEVLSRLHSVSCPSIDGEAPSVLTDDGAECASEPKRSGIADRKREPPPSPRPVSVDTLIQ